MLDLENNLYYKRLSKVLLLPTVVIVFLGSVYVIIQVLIFYFKYVPELMIPLEETVPPQLLLFVENSIYNIIFYLGVWVLVSFLMNILLVYVVWNVKKLLAELRGQGEAPWV